MRKLSSTARTIVRLSVPLPVEAHARLCGVAALRQVDRSALAAEFILRGLRGSRIIEPTGQEPPVESEPTVPVKANGRLPL